MSPNTTIGQYKIISKIGEGGMGVVYRARDTKLRRDVAIKVLSHELAKNSDWLNRFQQEARSAGSLNHPNILVIYEIGTHEGAPYMVSELLEGQTLRKQIARGPLSQGKVVEYALQIAKGLAAAHEKGIVHRDIKPENIFITRDSRVKILDFGLSKLMRGSERKATQTGDTTEVNTNPGTLMGTITYMSPEQVKGQRVDHRSDIFSFGAVLYEMLSGRSAFRRKSVAETMSAIINEDLPNLSETNKTISPALEMFVQHCLEKSPAERFHSARDLGYAIASMSGISGASKTEILVDSSSARRRLWPKLFAGVAVLTLVIAAAVIAGVYAGKSVWKTVPPSYQRLTFNRGTAYNARFAPDGQSIIYSARWNGDPLAVFATRAGNSESRSLNLEKTDLLAVSASNEMAVLRNAGYQHDLISRGTLARLSVDGGAPRDLLEDAQEADWSPDGSKLAVVRWVNGRNQLEYPIGNVLYETTGYISHPRVSPKGDLIAFMDHQVDVDNRGWVAVVDLSGKKRFLSGEWDSEEGLAWSPTGDEIWFTASKGGEVDALYAVTLSGKERLVVRLTSGLMLHDISRDGRVLVSRYNLSKTIIGQPPGEKKPRDLSWLDLGFLLDLSADGKTILIGYRAPGVGTNHAIYARKTDGSPAVRLGDGAGGKLSPDGKWVLTTLLTPPQLLLLPTGAGETRSLERGPIEQYVYPASWSPDGKQVLFQGHESGHDWRYYLQSIDGGPPCPITPEGTKAPTSEGSFISPDGRWLIAADAQHRLAFYSVEGGSPQPIEHLESDDEIIGWSSDGDSLYVAQSLEMPIRIFRFNPTTGRREQLQEIMPADLAAIHPNTTILMTPDGKGYAYSVNRNFSDLYLVAGLK